jgi:lycopene beta-cyclase
MLYLGATPAEQVGVMQRVYTLGQPLIERFYGGRLTLADKARLLIGKPPIAVRRALASMPPSAAWRGAAAGEGRSGGAKLG